MSALTVHLWCNSGYSWLACISCRRNLGRSQHHASRHERSDMAFTVEYWIPSKSHKASSERVGNTRIVLILLRHERCASWNVIFTKNFAASYLSLISSCTGAATATWKEENIQKSQATIIILFFPLAFETFKPINQPGYGFFSSLGLLKDDIS